MNWVEKKMDVGIASVIYTVNFDDNKKHYVSVGPCRLEENRYYLLYVVGAFTVIQETFEAHSLEEAKETAVARIKESVNSKIAYYEGLLRQIEAKI